MNLDIIITEDGNVINCAEFGVIKLESKDNPQV